MRFEKHTYVLWNEKSEFGICQRTVRSKCRVHFYSRNFTLKDNHVLLKGWEFHEILLWETHMCYSEMRRCYLGYVTILLEVSAVFIFCVEALQSKIIRFIWKGKNFLKCFCVKPSWVTLKWEALVLDMSTYCLKLVQSSLSL